MTEIKFRAWEKQLEEIIPVYNIDFQSKLINRGSVWRFFHEIELMQSTGLKDKNGVEIYEGDILKVPDLYETPENTLIMYHYEKVYFGKCSLFVGEESIEDDHEYIESYCEVIGNIYENKELLEDK